MANKLTIEVNQRDKRRLFLKLDQLDKAGQTGILKELKKLSKQTVDRMKSESPYDTGRLRTNIDLDILPNGTRIHSEAIDPETNKDYAPDQEYGTRFFPAQPYFYKNTKLLVQNFIVKTRALINKISTKR